MIPLANHTFGAELEFYLPVGATKQALAMAVSRRIGKPVVVEGYNHQLRGHWKIVSDASLSDSVRGAEMVSPILTGEEGLAELAAVCDAMSDFGCTVAKSCGFHIHVGARNLPLETIKNVVRIYQAYEATIDAMMPPSRRGAANNYCRSLAAVSAQAISGAATVSALSSAIGNGRYSKVNLESMVRHGTVEFRQHSGTLEGRKATMWARACIRIVMAAQAHRHVVAVETTAAQINRAKPGSKSWIIGNMMLRPEGASAPEVLAAVGWPSVSMNQQARACGLQVITQRRGRIVRYFARRDAVQTAAPASFVRTLQGFTALLGMNADEINYFRTRTDNLSGPVAWSA